MVKNMPEKKKILIVHNFYQIGGGEHTVFENEKRLLRDNGHEVIIYTRDNTEIDQSIIKKILLPFTTIFSIKTYYDIKRLIQQNKIDIVHCHNTFPLVSPSIYFAAWKCKVPVIQTIHNFRFLCPNGVFFRDDETCEDCLEEGLKCSIKHGCYRNSKLQTMVLVNMLRVHRLIGTYKRLRYIFLTEFNKEKFRSLLGEKLDQQFIKPNFEYIELPDIIDERDGSYIFIGRLDKNKGIDFIVDNWSSEKELYIFGNGALEQYVSDACKRNSKLHYMGFQSQEMIWKYLAKATAMIFPTDLYEGFPMTLIESFAFGTPVICSDIGNGADIVRKAQAGVSYKRRDKDDLLRAIEIVEKNFEEYSVNAMTAYKKNYTPEANYMQLKSIYEAVKG
jgi:glycosyltransferase involved in cell wall biosynthesis